MKVFGKKLKELRKAHNMTQEDLCNAMVFLDNNGRAVTKQTISYYEAGKYEPSFDGLVGVAEYFNVSTEYLLGLSDYANPQHEELSQKKIFSDDAIKDLLTFPDYTIETLELLFHTPWFVWLINAFKSYFDGIPESEILNFSGSMAKGTRVPWDSDEKVVEKQMSHAAINYASEMIFNYLDGIKKEREGE
jgi:transcriptional regulator with XRE-family HTH domain